MNSWVMLWNPKDFFNFRLNFNFFEFLQTSKQSWRIYRLIFLIFCLSLQENRLFLTYEMLYFEMSSWVMFWNPKDFSEDVEHFLEKNDFRPFPEMPISEGNGFFPKSKSHLQNRHKMFQKSFHENHFWVPSKSFSCVKNHFWTGRKWFFAPVNHFFAPKTARNHFLWQ